MIMVMKFTYGDSNLKHGNTWMLNFDIEDGNTFHVWKNNLFHWTKSLKAQTVVFSENLKILLRGVCI